MNFNIETSPETNISINMNSSKDECLLYNEMFYNVDGYPSMSFNSFQINLCKIPLKKYRIINEFTITPWQEIYCCEEDHYKLPSKVHFFDDD